MFRQLIGYAALAAVGIVALQFVFGLGAILIAILFKLVWLAILGAVFYWLLSVIFPEAAARIREAISGKPKSEE
ncbi:MAG: hypothetical protein O7D29_12220 [Gemmatimonadetes bacterium]|nr:hypothetical protein [Gemmatimonadota bacterium]